MSFFDPATTPATTSLWPPRYFEAECRTRSTPMVIGRWKTGVAQLLSITVRTLALGERRQRADVVGLEIQLVGLSM